MESALFVSELWRYDPIKKALLTRSPWSILFNYETPRSDRGQLMDGVAFALFDYRLLPIHDFEFVSIGDIYVRVGKFALGG